MTEPDCPVIGVTRLVPVNPYCVAPVISFVVCPVSRTAWHRCTWVMCDQTPRHPSDHHCGCGHHWPARQEQ